jgi:hypothetical protein
MSANSSTDACSLPAALSATDPATRELRRDLERFARLVDPEVAHDVGRELHADAVGSGAAVQTVEDGLDRAEPVVEPRGVVRRAEHRLRVPDAGGREVLAELLGDPAEVVRGRQERARLPVVPDEVHEPVEPPGVVAEAVRDGHAVPIGELPDRGDPDRTLEVDVQLGLREGTEVAHGPMVASAA